MIKNVLVATDGSDNANRAVEFASDLAAHYGAALAVVHVLLRDHLDEGLRRFAEVEHIAEVEGPSIPELMGRIPRAYFPRILVPAKVANSTEEILQAVADQILHSAEEVALKNGVAKVSKMLKDGSAARCILDAAKETKADLIVLGTRGLSGIEELFQGSVSHKVTQTAPCAVTLVR